MFEPRNSAITGLIAAGAVAVLCAAPVSAQTYQMKIGFVTVNDSQHESAKMFAAEIDKRTNGAIKARIFPLAQLGKIPRQVEGVQLGTQEAFISPPGFFVGINPAFQAPDAPAMFESQWHQHKALNHPTVRDKFLGLAKRANVQGIYTWSAGKTAIATRDPVKTVGDIQGKKIRVLASKMEVAFMKSMGAAGIPMPYSEVLPAIQRRVIDGVRSGIIVMGPSKFYTAAKHIYNDGLGFIPSGMWVSQLWMNKLPAKHRTAIVETGKSITDKTGIIAAQFTAKWEKLWIEKGGTVTEPSAKDRAEMIKRSASLGDEILGKNPKTKDMFELIKAAAEKTRGAKMPKG